MEEVDESKEEPGATASKMRSIAIHTPLTLSMLPIREQGKSSAENGINAELNEVSWA